MFSWKEKKVPTNVVKLFGKGKSSFRCFPAAKIPLEKIYEEENGNEIFNLF